MQICFVVINAALATASSLPQRSARLPAKDDNFRIDDVVLIEVFSQSFHIINFDNHTNSLAEKHQKALHQTLCSLAACVGHVPFVVFFTSFSVKRFTGHALAGHRLPLYICQWKQARLAFHVELACHSREVMG